MKGKRTAAAPEVGPVSSSDDKARGASLLATTSELAGVLLVKQAAAESDAKVKGVVGKVSG